MLDLISRARDLAPHGYCLFWDPALVWTHVLADALIAAAYFSIPVALLRFVRKRADIEFSWIFWLFALFIMACGATHLMSIWTLWNPDYHLEAAIKVITAIASVGTAIVLWPLIPKALALPSPSQLQEANILLSRRVIERDEAVGQLRREIEGRERAEEALRQAQKMEAVGQLTGGIAHDFNNLLTVVLGSLDRIHKSTLEPATKRAAGNALQAAQRGAKLTGQLLAFSRTQKLQLKPTVVPPLIENMEALLRQTLGPSVTIELRLEGGEVPVLADATQLELAIMNLAINARDAMPSGGTLAIATEAVTLEDDAELPAGQYLMISVTDTGAGMPPEVAERAFEPFYTTKPVGQGTGLGLSMVYGVARQSGGTARIATAPGEGVTISILLPRTAEQSEPGEAAAPSETPSVAETPVSILVIDDEKDVREIICDTLVEAGHQVRQASDGEAALALLESERFDLLVIDFAMPGMNGADLAAAARKMRPDQKILFVTGYSETRLIETAAGDAPVLRKPFRSAELSAAVARALAGRASARD